MPAFSFSGSPVMLAVLAGLQVWTRSGIDEGVDGRGEPDHDGAPYAYVCTLPFLDGCQSSPAPSMIRSYASSGLSA